MEGIIINIENAFQTKFLLPNCGMNRWRDVGIFISVGQVLKYAIIKYKVQSIMIRYSVKSIKHLFKSKRAYIFQIDFVLGKYK